MAHDLHVPEVLTRPTMQLHVDVALLHIGPVSPTAQTADPQRQEFGFGAELSIMEQGETHVGSGKLTHLLVGT